MPTNFQKLFWLLNLEYYHLQKSLRELKSLGVEITDRCNLECRHCYMRSVKNNAAEKISMEEWHSFFYQLKKYFGNKVYIQITGGEPLARQDIFLLLEELKRLGFNVGLATNGLLINVENIKIINKCCDSLSISLDGFRASHNYLRQADAFDLAARNIKLAKKSGAKYLTIKTSVFKNNLAELEEFYNFIEELGADEWHFFAAEPAGRGKEYSNDLLSVEEYKKLCVFADEIKKRQGKIKRIIFEESFNEIVCEKACDSCQYKLCHAGISSAAILADGSIVSCVQDDRDKLAVQGNIRADAFKKVWEEKFIKNRARSYMFCGQHYFLNKLLKNKKL